LKFVDLGCQPIDTLTFERIEQRYFGCLTDIKQIHIGDKQYLQFVNANRSFHTLVLCSNNEQSLIELKVESFSKLNFIKKKIIFFSYFDLGMSID